MLAAILCTRVVVVPPIPTPIVVQPGGVKHKSRPQIVVVEVNGRDYRVRIENLAEFLDLRKEKIVEAPAKKAKKKRKTVERKPPKIVVKDVPREYKVEVQQIVDRSNEILRKLWESKVLRLLCELDDEEAILLALL